MYSLRLHVVLALFFLHVILALSLKLNFDQVYKKYSNHNTTKHMWYENTFYGAYVIFF